MPREPIPTLSSLDPVIRTARLLLRPLRERDVDDLWPTVSDPAFPLMMSWSAHTERRETVEFIHGQAEAFARGVAMTSALEHEGRAVGCISLDGIRWGLGAWRVDRAELGYWLAPALWRRGLMTEAARAVMRFAFEALGLHKLTVGCVAENDGSRRVIEKCGFRFVGRLEDDVFRAGRWWSQLRYELLAREWREAAAQWQAPR